MAIKIVRIRKRIFIISYRITMNAEKDVKIGMISACSSENCPNCNP